ncbi:MAG: peptide ABC transporter substrate-binding protein [Silvanigrellaceae bacterium]|nr:peptide ABC transporter substrate-binding protein [Silvanigrellaceae bacterium]
MPNALHKVISLSYLLSVIMSCSGLHSAFGAEVPSGTKLAKQQILNRGNGAEAPTIDPQKVEDVQGNNITQDLYEGLVRDNTDGIIVPAGATSWESSKDGLTYTFHLRKNAKWSNGDPITAHDYVYGFQRLVDPKVASTYSFLISDFKNADAINQGKEPLNTLGVVALNNETLQIKLNNPVPYILDILSMRNCSPAHKKMMEKYGDKFYQVGNLVSNGPYVIKYWKIGDKLTLEKNSNYWDAKKTVIQEVHFYPTQNLNTEQQMFLTNQLDITNDISMDQFEKLKSQLGSEVQSNPYLSSYWFSFNLEKPPFKDNLKLRQALSMVIDRDIITKYITRRGEFPSYDLVAKGAKNYKQFTYNWSKDEYKIRVEKAKKLYEEAGYSALKPLKVNILYNTNDNSKKLVLSIASMWKQALGVNATLENQEWKVFLKSRQNGEFQVAWDRWIADYNDVNSFSDLLRSGSQMNNAKYKNTNYDTLLKKASMEVDLKKRQKILEKASSVLMNDYPILPLYSAVTTHLVKKYVGGYSGKNPLDHTSTFDLYIKEH